MMLKNSPRDYGLVTKLLHWLVALLLLGLIWLGWYMVDLSYYDPWYHDALTAHKALGMIVLGLGLAKIAWTVYSRLPKYSSSLKPWERISAHAMHLTLFVMMVAIPVTGYFISTSAGDAISIFGWFDIPALFTISDRQRDLAIDLHFYLTYATAGLVLIHALAAFKHQLVDRDGTLRRML
jgi:cytochrome b561